MRSSAHFAAVQPFIDMMKSLMFSNQQAARWRHEVR